MSEFLQSHERTEFCASTLTVAFRGELPTDSTNPHFRPLVGRLPVLRLSFYCCPLQRVYATVAEVSVLWGLLGRIAAGDRRSLWFIVFPLRGRS